jgi:hypothetical protein
VPVLPEQDSRVTIECVTTRVRVFVNDDHKIARTG